MKWRKAIRKGLEAGIPAALGAVGISRVADATNLESVVTGFGAALAGFVFGLVKNWLKHRKWVF